MRRSAHLAFALAAVVVAAGGSAPAQAEYYCSPGFVPSYGRCIATAATDQIDLYLNEPGGYLHEEVAPVPLAHHRHHRRHGLRARY